MKHLSLNIGSLVEGVVWFMHLGLHWLKKISKFCKKIKNQFWARSLVVVQVTVTKEHEQEPNQTNSFSLKLIMIQATKTKNQ